jgi:hypothetical protein
MTGLQFCDQMLYIFPLSGYNNLNSYLYSSAKNDVFEHEKSELFEWFLYFSIRVISLLEYSNCVITKWVFV